MSTTAERLRDLFDAAIALPPAKRAEFLDRSCRHDALLRAEVERLLASETTQDDEALSARAAAAATEFVASAPWIGRRVGSYRILRELGSGGMGSVYLAERADAEYESRVAIKLIRGFPSADALERLRHERQVLAGLVHPNIARLLDGGTTTEGQPFLVIEYVEGLALLDWAAARQPTLKRRLDVFLQLCRAVHYAHQNLIVHRDLKPGNVIVRDDDTPVLLDFGIAKLTAPDASGSRPTELRAFTEDYASPEQIEGGAVTTASDVYALGLVLYELLCGKRYRSGGRSESWRQARPGRVAHAASELWLKREAGQVGGDLEHIVRRALAPEPAERYASAAAFAADVERYFSGQALEAGPDRIGYRLGKFVSRHRAPVAAACAGVVLILGAALWLGIERHRALRAERRAAIEAQTANKTTDFLLQLFQAVDPANAQGKELSARELLDGGREMLARQALADQPQVRARLLSALGQIYISIGQPQRATELSEEAVQLLRRPDGDPLRLAYALNELCRAQTMASDYAKALPHCREGLSIRSVRLAPDHVDIGHSLMALGVVEQEVGHYDVARENYTRALAIFSAAGPEHADDVAAVHHNLGFLAGHRQDWATARREYQIAYDSKRALLGDSHPNTLVSLSGLAAAEGELGDRAAQLAHLETDLALSLKVHGADSVPAARMHNDIAGALQDAGDYAAAEMHYRAALDSYARLTAADSIEIAQSTNNLATLYEDRGDLAAAQPLFRRSLAIRSAKFTPPHPSIARAQNNLARCLLESGDAAAAQPLLDAALAARRALFPDSGERFDSELLALEIAHARGQDVRTAVEALTPPAGRAGYKRRARWFALRARSAADAQDFNAARRLQQQALDALREVAGAKHPLYAQGAARLAAYAHAAGDDAAARAALTPALAVLRANLVATADDRVAAEALAATLR